jgi:hypothetical protein
MTHKRRAAVALSSRLSTRFIGSFADKPTESGDPTFVWGRSSASPKRPACKRRGHYGQESKKGEGEKEEKSQSEKVIH